MYFFMINVYSICTGTCVLCIIFAGFVCFSVHAHVIYQTFLLFFNALFGYSSRCCFRALARRYFFIKVFYCSCCYSRFHGIPVFTWWPTEPDLHPMRIFYYLYLLQSVIFCLWSLTIIILVSYGKLFDFLFIRLFSFLIRYPFTTNSQWIPSI